MGVSSTPLPRLPYQEWGRPAQALEEDGSHAPEVRLAVVALTEEDLRGLGKRGEEREREIVQPEDSL